MITKIVIPGTPQGKGRAKVVFRKNLGHTVAITPDKTVMYENLIKTCFVDQGGHYQEGPLRMTINAYYPIPKSTSKRQAALMRANEIRPTKKPDTDNIAKVVADALNGLAYKDDAQIVAMEISKFYSDVPQVIVAIGGIGQW